MSESKNETEIPHVVLRVGPSFSTVRGSDVVAAHNEIVNQRKAVYLGKGGRRMGVGNRDCLLNAIERQQSPHLFLLRKKRAGFEVFDATLFGVAERLSTRELDFVPSYYRSLAPDITTWFNIGSLQPVDNSILSRLEMYRSGRLLPDVLAECRTVLMLVKWSNNKTTRERRSRRSLKQ